MNTFSFSASTVYAGLERNAAVRGAPPPDVKMKFVLKQKGSRHIVTAYYPTHLRWKTFLLRSPVLSGKKAWIDKPKQARLAHDSAWQSLAGNIWRGLNGNIGAVNATFGK